MEVEALTSTSIQGFSIDCSYLVTYLVWEKTSKYQPYLVLCAKDAERLHFSIEGLCILEKADLPLTAATSTSIRAKISQQDRGLRKRFHQQT